MVVWESIAGGRSAGRDGGVWKCGSLYMGRAEERNEREEAVAFVVAYSEVEDSKR